MALLLDSIFLPRGSTDEKKAEALEIIRERQALIEETGKYNPLLVFAEGITTNNSALGKFKKGAFVSNKRCLPVIMNYEVGTVHPAYDTAPLFALAILQLSMTCMKVTITELPEFEPTEYMYENFKEFGDEPWEIYAHCLREAMCEAGGLDRCN